MQMTARPGGPLQGRVRAPGDKSISHRALILGALATGETRIEGLLEGDDVRRTAAAVAAFGADVACEGALWRVAGRGRLAEPADVIDCGNSGTGVRLLMGAAAGFPLTVTFTGDASLRGRPMARVLDPLQEMGALTLARDGARLPATIRGGALKPIVYRTPMASAQVKSAVLLAGLAHGASVIEAERTRDHTERMLRAFGASLEEKATPEGWRITLQARAKLQGQNLRVPGDPSSAAFPLAAALITPGSDVTVENVLLNPLRTGLFATLLEMSADLTITDRRSESGEEVGDVRARFSTLRGVEVPALRAPSMIDEYPILAALSAFAEGPTIMRGLKELRVKESDRIALMAAGLSQCGVDVIEEPEGLIVSGVRGANHGVEGGASVVTHGDHRIAMAHLVLGLAARQAVRIDESEMIATSFPGFAALMRSLGADIVES
jgi:3-phosphoshikimate 1-carboxyvinyltransferase